MSTVLTEIDPEVAEALRAAIGDAHVIADRAARFHRARVPAPFPVHRWAEHVPGIVVLPGTTADAVRYVSSAKSWGSTKQR